MVLDVFMAALIVFVLVAIVSSIYNVQIDIIRTGKIIIWYDGSDGRKNITL